MDAAPISAAVCARMMKESMKLGNKAQKWLARQYRPPGDVRDGAMVKGRKLRMEIDAKTIKNFD
jgi:hypothetical protein